MINNINKRIQEEISFLYEPCEECGQPIIEHLKKGEVCCSGPYTLNSNVIKDLLKKFWIYFNGSLDGVEEVLHDKYLFGSLLRLIDIAYKWGLQNPLIIPTTVKWEATHSCNLNCKHCLANAGCKIDNELSCSEVIDLIDQCVDLGIQNFGILGGEPLLRADIFDIIEYLEKCPLNVTISTNATLIDDSFIERISKSKIRSFSVSVDGLECEHDYLRGKKGSFNKALDGIKRLKRINKRVSVLMVVTRQNINQIYDVMSEMKKLGVNKFGINDLLPFGRGKDIEEYCITQEQYEELAAEFKTRNLYSDTEMMFTWTGAGSSFINKEKPESPFTLSKCGAALTELTVGSEGTIRACAFLPKSNENIRNEKLENIWFNSLELKKYQSRDNLEGQCGSCKHRIACSGCRARAEAYTGKINSEDPRCLIGRN